MAKTLYEILGVTPSASHEEIKAACLKLVLKYRSASKQDSREYKDKLNEIRDILNILNDPYRRKSYDKTLQNPVTTPGKSSHIKETEHSKEPAEDAPAAHTRGRRYFKFALLSSAIAILLVVVAFVAYMAGSFRVPNTHEPPKAEDPVKEFEQDLFRKEKITNSYGSFEVDRANGKWNKTKKRVENLLYDIKKTDSLVTPLYAEVTFDCYTWEVEKESKEAIEASEFPDKPSISAVIKHYGYQDGVWKHVSQDLVRYKYEDDGFVYTLKQQYKFDNYDCGAM